MSSSRPGRKASLERQGGRRRRARGSQPGAGVVVRKRARTAPREADDVYRAMVNAAADGIVLVDAETLRFVEFNDAACQGLGYSREEFARLALSDTEGSLTPEETRDRVRTIVRDGGGQIESTQRRKDRSLRGVHVTNRVVRIRGRNRLIALWHDVTERNDRKDALREAQERTRGVIDQTFQFIGLMTTEGVMVEANETALQLVGIEKSAVIGRPFWETPWWTHSADLQERLRDAVQRAARGETVRFEATHPGGDGVLHYVDFSLKPLKAQNGAVKYLIPEGRDITELKRAERERSALEVQLRQAQRLEAIGRLAAGIAHEINTPLQFISDNTCFVRDAFREIKIAFDRFHRLLQDGEAAVGGEGAWRQGGKSDQTAQLGFLMDEVPRAIQDSLDGSQRVSRIVQAMKEFSHPGSDEKTAVDLNRAIASTITVARNEWKQVAELETDWDSTLPLVPCVLGEFNQAILNVLINASQAVADVVGDGRAAKGRITVSTRRVGGFAEVRIADTGAGIPESARQRVFDPFFTTKPVGKGTGQGLAIAHSVVVDQHGGSIEFESAVGQGTTFVIRLPLDIGLTSNAQHGARGEPGGPR
jgi:two-component system, NtrC family, sensor kinase